MAHIIKALIGETSSATPVGQVIVLDAAIIEGGVTTHKRFSAVCSVSDTTEVMVRHDTDGSWAACIATYSAANELTLTSTIESSTGSAITWAAGGLTVVLTPLAATLNADIQVFTATGTWNKPKGKVSATIWGVGPGGAGGSGGRAATTVVRTGGAGGGGGSVGFMEIALSALADTEAVTIENATGGAAVTANSTGGNSGTGAGTPRITSFGAWLRILGGTSGGGGSITISPVTGGVGVSAANAFLASAQFASSAGGSGTNTTGTQASAVVAANQLGATGGGGGGGAAASSTTNAAGGAGRTINASGTAMSGYNVARTAGAGGTTGGTAATAGGAAPTNMALGAAGSGGGAYITGTAGGAGANGANYGGGGGGGGASDNGFNSGAGGDGGLGILIVVCR